MKINENVLEALRNDAEEVFMMHKEKINPAHRWDHVERVIVACNKILIYEKDANQMIVKAAAILHDLGRYKNSEGDHAYWSGELAKQILSDKNIDDKEINIIVRIIKYHSMHGDKVPPDLRNNLEFNILTDADKIDSFGPIGVLRAPLDKRFQKSYEEQYNHIKEKSDPNKFELNTSGGLKIGKKYKDFLHNFLIEYNFQKGEFEK